MVGKKSMSVLLPSHHHHHRRTSTVDNNLVLSPISSNISSGSGNKCGQKHHWRSSSPNSTRHNVAIATQVINPRAIGGSLHRRRLVRPFQADYEDEDSLGGRRSGLLRVNWRNIGCYGLTIMGVLLVMTGVVLAVGYMQSEKQRILSRSAKLAQSDSVGTNSSGSDLDSDTKFNLSQEKEETFPINPIIEEEETATASSTSEENQENDDENTSEELQINQPTTTEDQELLDTGPDESGFESLGLGSNLEPRNESTSYLTTATPLPLEESELHKPPAEVKVLPPKNFNFEGFSFDIPIYNESGKDETSFTFQVLPPLPTTAPSINPIPIPETPNDLEDIPVVAKLQTDLFEAGTESGEADADYEHSPKNHKSRSESGRNPPKTKVPNRTYTPRPGSVNKNAEKSRPPRPGLFKQKVKFVSSQESSAGEDDGGSQHYNSNLGGSSVSVLPPPKDFKFVVESQHATIQPSQPAPIQPSQPIPAPLPDYATFDFSSSSIKLPDATPSTVSTLGGYEQHLKFDFTTPPPNPTLAVTLPPTSVDLRFDFNNFATAHGLDLNPKPTSSPSTASLGNTLEIDYSQFSKPTPVPNLQTSTASQFSKRTFQFQNPYLDSTGSGTSNTNHFAHLLGPQQSVTSNFGSLSPLGASLNIYNNNYDSGGSGGSSHNYGNIDTGFNFNFGGDEGTKLAPGVIPLDLARSYIQAGPPGHSYNTNSGGGGNGGNYQADSFNYNYNDPTQALASLIQSNAGSGDYSGASNTNSVPNNYNTITQGIHLLSLLSGNIPNHLLAGQGHDQHSASSTLNLQQDFSTKPEYQIAALAGYGGSSGSGYLSGLNSDSSSGSTGNYNPYLLSSESRSLPSYTSDLYASKTFPDQEGSFSQHIVSKLGQAEATSRETGGSARSGKSISAQIPKSTTKVEDHSSTLDIIGLRALLNKFIQSGSTSLEEKPKLEEMPKTQKALIDMETAASEMRTQSQLKKPELDASSLESAFPEFGRKILLRTRSQQRKREEDDGGTRDVTNGSKESDTSSSGKGLRSGFYI